MCATLVSYGNRIIIDLKMESEHSITRKKHARTHIQSARSIHRMWVLMTHIVGFVSQEFNECNRVPTNSLTVTLTTNNINIAYSSYAHQNCWFKFLGVSEANFGAHVATSAATTTSLLQQTWAKKKINKGQMWKEGRKENAKCKRTEERTKKNTQAAEENRARDWVREKKKFVKFSRCIQCLGTGYKTTDRSYMSHK